MKSFLSLLTLLLFVTACRTRGPEFDPYAPDEGTQTEGFAPVQLTDRSNPSLLRAPTDPYRLGPGDVIEIEALGESAGRATLIVGPDGKVYYSLLPGVSVWGLSLPESRAHLQREMAKFTRATPELVINLRAAASQRVWIMGAVASPGVYVLSTPTTLLEALAGSGWTAAVDDIADLSRSFVLRNGQLLPVDFERLLKQGDLSQNVYLLPDDFIFIRPADMPSVYLLGAINSPNVIPYTRDLSVSKAIITAGGTMKYAQQSRVVIVRGGLTQPKIAEVNYKAIVTGKARDARLQPGDIVYVPFSPFRHLGQLTEDILDQFVRTVAVNEGSAFGGSDERLQLVQPFGSINTQ
jgi:protein involved in polysaccharide export with SLBB domain